MVDTGNSLLYSFDRPVMILFMAAVLWAYARRHDRRSALAGLVVALAAVCFVVGVPVLRSQAPVVTTHVSTLYDYRTHQHAVQASYGWRDSAPAHFPAEPTWQAAYRPVALEVPVRAEALGSTPGRIAGVPTLADPPVAVPPVAVPVVAQSAGPDASPTPAEAASQSDQPLPTVAASENEAVEKAQQSEKVPTPEPAKPKPEAAPADAQKAKPAETAAEQIPAKAASTQESASPPPAPARIQVEPRAPATAKPAPQADEPRSIVAERELQKAEKDGVGDEDPTDADMDRVSLEAIRLGCTVQTVGHIDTMRSWNVGPRYLVPRTKHPPNIDGNLDEWQNVEKVELEDDDYVRGGRRRGAHDLSGSLRMLWDESSLYFALDASDDFVNAPAYWQQHWQSDCCQFAFDSFLNGPQQGFDDQDLSYCATRWPTGPMLFHYRIRGRAQEQRGKLRSQHIGFAKRLGGYRYEWAIPWEELAPVSPWIIGRTGFSFSINDNDGGGFKGAMAWTPGVVYALNAAQLGQLEFVGAIGARPGVLEIPPESPNEKRWLLIDGGLGTGKVARLVVRPNKPQKVFGRIKVYRKSTNEIVALSQHSVQAGKPGRECAVFTWFLDPLAFITKHEGETFEIAYESSLGKPTTTPVRFAYTPRGLSVAQPPPVATTASPPTTTGSYLVEKFSGPPPVPVPAPTVPAWKPAASPEAVASDGHSSVTTGPTAQVVPQYRTRSSSSRSMTVSWTAFLVVLLIPLAVAILSRTKLRTAAAAALGVVFLLGIFSLRVSSVSSSTSHQVATATTAPLRQGFTTITGGERPEWVEAKPTLVDGQLYRASAASGRFATRAECEAKLKEAIKKVGDKYIDDSLHPGAAEVLAVSPEYLESRVKVQEYAETVEHSFGPMQQMHALLEFDKGFHREISELWRRARINERLTLAGSLAFTVVIALGAAWGILKRYEVGSQKSEVQVA